MGPQFWPFGTFDWDQQWHWDISKKDIPWSYVISTWPWLSQMVKHVAITPTLTVKEEKETTIPMHWPAAFARLFACFTYPLWILYHVSLNQCSSGFNPCSRSTPLSFCQPVFSSKKSGIYYIHKKQGFKRLRTNVFQEWDRGGDRPAPWEFGVFHSWRLARSFGFRVLANRWFLVSRLGLNWREGFVCVDARQDRLRYFDCKWLKVIDYATMLDVLKMNSGDSKVFWRAGLQSTVVWQQTQLQTTFQIF